jgi:xanthine/CO dehydrogenase XdhC/CoxF family maturation factor
MAYSRPGVYITERLLPPVLPNGVTANAAGAVVAPFAQGPEAVTLVSSWYDFTKNFGGYNASYPATFQVGSFFANGGRELYVQRLLADDADAATVNILNSGSSATMTITAKNAGADGNNLRVVLTTGSVADTYTLTVYKESGVANNIADDILLERYENVVTDDPTSSDFVETVVNLVSSYISVDSLAAGLNSASVSATYPLTSGSNGTTPVAADYTDYKVGVSKAFKVGKTEGWTAGLYYTGNNNKDYWGSRGYGGASFNGSAETKNLADDRMVFTVTRSF